MKKIITLSFALCGLIGFAQTDTEEVKSDYNKWSIDVGAGVTKPVRPVSSGAFTNTPSLFQADLGVRYMVNDKFGFNADFGYNNFSSDENSRDFDSRYYRVTLEGVVNAGHIVGLHKLHDRLGLLLHGGMGVSNLKGTDPVETGNDWMLNFQAGITPQIRLSNSVALFGDLSVLGHVRQDITFDGLSRASTRGFDGMLVNASVGLNIYLGNGDVHSDWYTYDVEEKIDNLTADVEKMATDYADDDKDGVPNYIDRDNTTESGVRVDNKGRAIDLNNNSIPDDMESALDGRYASKADLANMKLGANGANGMSDKGIIKKLINEGYVNVYFQFNSTKPALYSLGAINTLVTYMKDNPSATATLTGYADELGSPAYNKNLSERRAKMVHDVLVASGVDASRLSHNGNGEDASVDKNSSEARQLVRRVTFRVN
ncbi:outer membrane protein A precursor [Nonlabens ulvanivorans]|uniref:Outer membrane protein A n=1 Tax=Nonlabens ulvanivorans TaxID=906888 RepID=A0A090WH28_NONUL|nr:OmpA family protein [Nonlabens ulvanivorans]GAL76291.1 outer membrane protein A precursor [Nonlabens ulvanivorans]